MLEQVKYPLILLVCCPECRTPQNNDNEASWLGLKRETNLWA